MTKLTPCRLVSGNGCDAYATTEAIAATHTAIAERKTILSFGNAISFVSSHNSAQPLILFFLFGLWLFFLKFPRQRDVSALLIANVL
jgi:hypothetical protein